MIQVQNSILPASPMESFQCVEPRSSSLPYDAAGMKAPLEYQPMSGNHAFKDLLATPHITKSTAELSQGGEEMKHAHRLQKYSAQQLKRARRMVNFCSIHIKVSNTDSEGRDLQIYRN